MYTLYSKLCNLQVGPLAEASAVEFLQERFEVMERKWVRKGVMFIHNYKCFYLSKIKRDIGITI